MPTFTALTTLMGRDPAYTLGEAMERMDPAPTGVGVFEVEDGSGLWEVGGYFDGRPDETALAVLAAAMDAKDFTVSELPETDWVAHVRRELSPVRAGRFFVSMRSSASPPILPRALRGGYFRSKEDQLAMMGSMGFPNSG